MIKNLTWCVLNDIRVIGSRNGNSWIFWASSKTLEIVDQKLAESALLCGSYGPVTATPFYHHNPRVTVDGTQENVRIHNKTSSSNLAAVLRGATFQQVFESVSYLWHSGFDLLEGRGWVLFHQSAPTPDTVHTWAAGICVIHCLNEQTSLVPKMPWKSRVQTKQTSFVWKF